MWTCPCWKCVLPGVVMLVQDWRVANYRVQMFSATICPPFFCANLLVCYESSPPLGHNSDILAPQSLSLLTGTEAKAWHKRRHGIILTITQNLTSKLLFSCVSFSLLAHSTSHTYSHRAQMWWQLSHKNGLQRVLPVLRWQTNCS